MASIREEPSGAGKRDTGTDSGVSTRGLSPTKTLARRWAADMEADFLRGEWSDPALGRVIFGEWASEFLGTIVPLRAITQGDYPRALRVHVLPASSAVPIARIDPVNVLRFIAEKQAEGLAPRTLQRVRLVLRQVFRLGEERGGE